MRVASPLAWLGIGVVASLPSLASLPFLVLIGLLPASLGAEPPPVAASLPAWQEPEAYSVELRIQSGGGTYTMRRNVDHGRIRTHMGLEDQEVVLIELGDEAETMYMLMPSQETAIKQSSRAMKQFLPDTAATLGGSISSMAVGPQGVAGEGVELLGTEMIDGRSARKYRATSPEGAVLAWFDDATSAPIRMEAETGGEKSVLEWKDLNIGPQKAELFEIPKGYNVQDMDEMMKQAQAMGGMPGMGGALGGMGGMSGIGGMPGMGGLGGMGGQMGSQFGSQMGSQVGATFGGSLGGPLGAMAGGYIGGKIGGFLGRKAAGAVLPGH